MKRPISRLRSATLADAEGILRVEEASFARAAERFNLRQIRHIIRSPRGRVYVAQSGGDIVAWGASLLRTVPGRRPTGRIYSVAVHPSAQRQRLGQRLLRVLLRHLRARGVHRVGLEVRHDNLGAIELYRKLGFVAEKRLPHYYGRRVHGMRMVRTDKGASPN